jgi:type IV pilus assembly protein PilN
MANINLLPWREWERERKKNEFFARLGLVFVLGAVMIFAGGWFLDGARDDQRARNGFMSDKIAVLDGQIAEIRELSEKREQLLARMRVIQELQGNRPVIVRVFDELVRTLAKGVYYNSVVMSSKNLTMSGTSESNNRISTLMRGLDESGWFSGPNLKGLRENAQAGAQASDFQLTVNQTNPQAAQTEEG